MHCEQSSPVCVRGRFGAGALELSAKCSSFLLKHHIKNAVNNAARINNIILTKENNKSFVQNQFKIFL